ncbi:hypothetical protein L2719_17515 [Shewanella schlegeliana]|uniref:Peptidase M15 n=1 Tax=Shewanella schlegeliana TaxID=190308 RepID=A0ABS1SU55_9GAMM|nr:hypothetical protein [Shewanella schlegeliana]MBL4912071.1 hypothetical protein [Shewanella schlegeliana]MCL1111332.1 hypothetical protein [Shewanella schlegeliana]GIU33051.1 hypothetical protein TUM4433_26860 [Shewanella schlegeliana]
MQSHSKLSKYFTLEDLLYCSQTYATQTYATQKLANIPRQRSSIEALKRLSVNLLDPIVEQFGPITLTYGFCSPELARAIKKNDNPHIAPNLDQHASHELNRKGKLICPRLGAAVDFFVDAMPNQMDEVALWIAENLKFDRIYYYGKSRPLHISYGPEMNQFVQLMNTNEITGRRTPGKRANGKQACDLFKQIIF